MSYTAHDPIAQTIRIGRARGAALVIVTSRRATPASAWFHALTVRIERARTQEALLRLEALADIMFDLACTIEGPESVGGVEI